MICTNCHYEAKYNDKICPACGGDKFVEDSEEIGIAWDVSKSKVPTFLAAIIIFFPLMIAGLFYEQLPIFIQERFGIFYIAAAVIIIIALMIKSIIKYFKHKKLVSDPSRLVVKGEIVDYKLSVFITRANYPIIEYAVDGKKYRLVSHLNDEGDKIGERIAISCNKNFPLDAVLYTDDRPLEVALVCIVAGALVAAGAIFVFIFPN